MNNDDLDKLLLTGSVTECVTALAGLSEKERKPLSERALLWLKVSTGFNLDPSAWGVWMTQAGELATWVRPTTQIPREIQKLLERKDEAKRLSRMLPSQAMTKDAIEPARAAVLATCILGEIKRHDGQPRDADACYAIISARKPRWAAQWASYILDQHPEIYWTAVRRLERDELFVLDPNGDYLLAMAVGMATAKHIKEELRSDATLRSRVCLMLADDVVNRAVMQATLPSKWKTRDWRRVGILREAGSAWMDALFELSHDHSNILPVTELLDANMTALTRLSLEGSEAVSKANLRWFCGFHARFSAGECDDALYADRLTRLLYSRNLPTAGWALERLTSLVLSPASATLSFDSLYSAVEAVFLVKGKENAVKAVDLLAAIASSIEAQRTAATMTAVSAFENESPHVQKRALGLIEKYGAGDATVCQRLHDSLESLAVVHRLNAQEWLQKQGLPAGVAAGSGMAEIPTDRGTRGSAFVVAEAPEPANLNQLLDSLAGVEPHLRACAGVDSAARAIEASEDDVPALEFDGTEYPRLNPEKKMQFAQDFDALVFMLSKGASTPEDHERCLAGIAKFGAERPADFEKRTAPLVKDYVVPSVGGAVAAWLGTRRFPYWYHPVDYLFLKLADSVGSKARLGQTQVLFSTPTHGGGWIDPLVLAQRLISKPGNELPEQRRALRLVAQAGELLSNTTRHFLTAAGFAGPGAAELEVAQIDQSLALLRMAPDKERRQKALALLEQESVEECEFSSALRYALGDRSVEVGAGAPLWIAAARARAPFEDDPQVESRFAQLGPDAGCAARYELVFDLIKIPDPKYHLFSDYRILRRLPEPAKNQAHTERVICCCMHEDRPANSYDHIPFINIEWASTAVPLLIESWFAHAAELIAHAEGSAEAHFCSKFIEKLYDSDVPLKPMALLTLSLGLSGKYKEQSAPAMESLIQAIDDGRLNSIKIAGAMQTLRQFDPTAQNVSRSPDLISLSRWSKSLKTAAQSSLYHGLVVRLAIERMLTGDPSQAPKDLHYILEVLLDQCVHQQQSLTLPASREYLAGIKTAGKTAKLIKQLLALKRGEGAWQIQNEALLYALERRIERAQRWQSWLRQNNDDSGHQDR